MKVDSILILAAGKGTRMGKIGQSLPKVLWPIFYKSLLELQVAYARELAPSAKIFINTYYSTKKIKNFIQNNKASFEGVELIEEQQVLDIGGAIHNVAAKLEYKGNLLILNSDQFLYSKHDFLSEGLRSLANFDSILFTYEVSSSDGYNALAIKESKLEKIILNHQLSRSKNIITYTGMSVINLEKLERVNGESKFFESVANPTKYNVGCLIIQDLNYWDFGTLERYYHSIKRILQGPKSDFYKFLIKHKALIPEDVFSDKVINCPPLKISEGKIINDDVVESISLEE
ncbi:MAG: hypothetical protein CME66_00295 [Halobacteriovoraceae bacterium]|nr:hypothetical protein [Halobacteriovoraceae bacterium]|tara:strand:- start:64 stop:927 length:864 start_codon:yes stop_codon:yes gene_type:complete